MFLTQTEWRLLMGPCDTMFPGDDNPIDRSLLELQRYLELANVSSPTGAPPLRLPIEAEWEHACRAGSDGPFSFAGEPHQRRMNFNDGVVQHAVVDGRLEVDWQQPPSRDCRADPMKS